MTLATATETTRLRRVRLKRARQPGLRLDALALACSLGVCAVFLAEGGLEALVFMLCGTALGAKGAAASARWQAAFSGALAGLFVGALFAAFFHASLLALATLL